MLLSLDLPAATLPHDPHETHPSKHARHDSEMFWLWPVMARVQPESGMNVYTGSDFLHPIQFCFSKKARTILCKTDPDLICMAWSGFGPTHHQESLGPIFGRMQQACY